MRNYLLIVLTFILLLLVSYILDLRSKAYAFGSSSTNYKLEGEFGIFGGAKSSASYNLTDTGGGFAVGFGSSANYGTGSGFQYVLAEVREITFTIEKNIVDLGTLSSASISSDTHYIKVSTNGAGGYIVTVLEDGNLCRTAQPCTGANDIDPVGDNVVSVGSEEYGLSTDKSGQEITYDADCAATFNAGNITQTAKTVASAALPIVDDTTNLCYAASISGTTAAGSYTHVLTYIATGTF